MTAVLSVTLIIIGALLMVGGTTTSWHRPHRVIGLSCAVLGLAAFAYGMYLVFHEQHQERAACEDTGSVAIPVRGGDSLCLTIIDGVLKEVQP